MNIIVAILAAFFAHCAIGHMPNVKGQKGEEGSFESLAARVRQLEESLAEYGKILKPVHCYMGMKSGDIPDSAITSSSYLLVSYAAKSGRLDYRLPESLYGGWIARRAGPDEWIQVDFGEPKLVAGVVTQGRPTVHQWVKTYKLQCGNSVSTLKFITENGAVKIFNGNRDRNTKVVNLLPIPMECRYIRLYTLSWNRHVGMRLEFIHGMCYDLFQISG